MSVLVVEKILSSSQNLIPVPINISKEVRELNLSFQKREGKYLTDTVQIIKDQNTGACFYGIHRDEQMVTNQDGQEYFEATQKRYAEIKSHILQQMQLQPNTPLLQVVGDSAAFSLIGTQKAMRFLQTHLPSYSAVAYGYTGHSEPDGTKCVNAAVSAYVVEKGLTRQTIGNLVGFHTPTALDSWRCSGPELNHYLLVYGKDESNRETGTVFGDDITTSDFLSDRLIMLEGGIQSFRQACNFLLLGRPIVALTGLRGEKTRFGLAEDGNLKNYFTAPEFLQFMKDKIKNLETSDACSNEPYEDHLIKVLNEWFDEYLSNHLFSDPKSKDYDTKKKLLDDAWKLFKAERLYTRLHLFSCESFPLDTDSKLQGK